MIPQTILDTVPAEHHDAVREWWASCEEWGLSPSRQFYRYRWWLGWRELTRNWWDDLARMGAVNWRCLIGDTRANGRQQRQFERATMKAER